MNETKLLFTSLSRYFSEYLPITKGLSSNSIRSYQYTFQLLFLYLKNTKEMPPDKVSFSILNRDTLEGFLAWIENVRSCSTVTRNHRLSSLSAFSCFAIKVEPIIAAGFYSAITNIPKKKCSKKLPIYFSKEEIRILLNLPIKNQRIASRDKVMLSVLYASGARAQELCDIKVIDVRFGEKTSIKLIGKGNKARIITIPSQCATLLETYLIEINKEKQFDMYVFSSQTHSHMSISCVEEVVKKYLMIARKNYPDSFRENKYTPHTFRHSIAVHMLEAGVPLPVIKNFLGHVSLETTLIYATVSDNLKNMYLKENSIIKDITKRENQPKKYDYESMGLSFLNRI